MKNLAIFGDSFARPSTFDYAWTNRLKRDYNNIDNFAYSSAGFDYSIKKFLEYDSNKNNDKRNIDIIFFVSALHRIDFKFYTNIIDQKLLVRPKEFKQKYKKYSKFYDIFLHDFYFYSAWEQTELLKQILYVKHKTQDYNKVLIFSVFKSIDDQEFTNLSSNNCIVFQESFMSKFNITGVEIYPDTRENHMDATEHDMVYNFINTSLQKNNDI